MLLQHFYNWHFSSDCNKGRILLLQKNLASFFNCRVRIFSRGDIYLGLISILFAITGTSSLWAIKELFEQEKRVNKGWFPKNSSRKWLLTAHRFKYGGFDKLNHRIANLLDSLICKNAARCWLFCRTFTPVRIVSL